MEASDKNNKASPKTNVVRTPAAVQQTTPATAANQKVIRTTIPKLRAQAIALHKKGDLKNAAVLYKNLLKLVPNDIGLWANLGVVYRQNKLYQSAINCYQRALQIKPGDSAALGNLANALKDLRRLDEAIAIHKQVVEQKPDDASARLNYAVAFRENGDYEQAVGANRKAFRTHVLFGGSASRFHPTLPQSLYLGRYEEGFRAYEARKRTGDLPVKTFDFPEWLGLLSNSSSVQSGASLNSSPVVV